MYPKGNMFLWWKLDGTWLYSQVKYHHDDRGVTEANCSNYTYINTGQGHSKINHSHNHDYNNSSTNGCPYR
jgi:hypothetical protein